MSQLTSWDDDLGQVLHPALTAYELDRILGSGNTGKLNRDFQHAIRHYIPEGHTFKGTSLSQFSSRLFSPASFDYVSSDGVDRDSVGES